MLIDCLLLARCRRLLRCTSAVGEYAVYFNEHLEEVNLNRQPLPQKAARRRHASTAQRLQLADFFGPGRLFEGAVLINIEDRSDRLERSMAELGRRGLADRVTHMSAFRHENGMYGCSVSHLEVVRYARWKGWRSVLILEDDLRFTDAPEEDAVRTLLDLGGRPWGIFQFGAMVEPGSVCPVSPYLFRFWQGHAAHALALHARCFDFLIDDYVCELDRGNWNLPMHVPFDEYVNNRLSHYVEAFGSRRLLISQFAGVSDTWKTPVDYSSLIESSYARL